MAIAMANLTSQAWASQTRKSNVFSTNLCNKQYRDVMEDIKEWFSIFENIIKFEMCIWCFTT